MTESSNSRISALDGLRGVAILLVMMDHFFSFPSANERALLFQTLSGTGWIGVDLFFVLSGFLITGVLLSSKGREGFFRRFYARRALRIFPIYYLYLVVYLIAIKIALSSGYGNEKIIEASHDIKWVFLYATNILIFFRHSFILASFNYFWSLAVEEHFYFFWPVVIFLCERKTLKSVVWVLFVLSILARIYYRFLSGAPNSFCAAYVFTPFRLEGFLLGGWVALLYADGEIEKLKVWARFLIPIGVIALIVSFWKDNLGWASNSMQSYGYPSLAFLFGGAVIQCLPGSSGSAFKNLMSTRILRFFGKYSYALYIFHVPIQVVTEHLLPFRIFVSLLHSRFLGEVFHAAISLMMSVGIALLSWKLIEEKCLRFKERWV